MGVEGAEVMAVMEATFHPLHVNCHITRPERQFSMPEVNIPSIAAITSKGGLLVVVPDHELAPGEGRAPWRRRGGV